MNNEAPRKPPWRIMDPVLVLILVNLIVIVLFKGFGREILSFVEKNALPNPPLAYLLLGTSIQALSLAGLVLFVVYKRGGQKEDLGLVTGGLGANLFLGLGGGLVLLALVLILSILISALALYLGIPQKPQPFVELLQQIKSWPGLLIALLIGSVLAPVSEELFFRGFTYPVLRARWGSYPAMVATSLVFAALHFDPVRFLPLTLGGLGLNYLYERTGSLYTSMVAHAVWNTTMTLLVFVVPR